MSADNQKYLYKDLTYKIIGALYEVHNALGPVHKEAIYRKAIKLEFKSQNIPFVEEKSIDVKYKGQKIGVYRPDLIIDDKVILEIKAVPAIAKAMVNQLYYYLKGTKYKLALLANFGTNKLSVKRRIYT